MGSIRKVTSIPGPNSQALQRRREQCVPKGVASATEIFAAYSDSALLTDVDGNTLIDFAGGIGCINVGHRHPAVVAAIREQIDRYLHVCMQVTPYEGYIALAEKLNQLAPGESAKKTVLVNSGAEAVENAIKIARAYTKRPAVICFDHAFHGRTMFALSLTSKTHPYKAEFGPLPGDVYRIPGFYSYRSTRAPVAETLEDAFRTLVAAETVAAIIIEPVMGEGGFLVQPEEFLQGLRSVCDRYGIVLVADEVQTGFGRTGAMFACNRLQVEPDILVSAKSLGGGMPIAAVTGKAEIMDAPCVGGIGGTFGGNPVSCAAALAAIEVLESEKLPARAELLGGRFKARASIWQKRWPIIGEVRGLGGMVALELVRSAVTLEPAAAEAKAIAKRCHENGLLLLVAGSFGNVLRLLFPLTVTEEQFDEGLGVLEAAIAEVVGESAHDA